MSDNGSVSTNGNGLGVWRTEPMYSFSEAAHLAGVSAATTRNWIHGYRERPPLLDRSVDLGPMLSFLDLIEIVGAARFRKVSGVSYKRVHQAYEFAKGQYRLEYPFAHLQLEAIGGHIVHLLQEQKTNWQTSLQALDTPEQNGRCLA